MRSQALEQLLNDLYQMPQVGADWRPLLTALGEAFRSHVVAFHSHDVLHQQGFIDTAVGVDDGLALRFKALANEHPWYVHGGERLLREGMADDKGLLPQADLFKSRFYGEVLAPLRVGHGMALLLRHDGPAQMTVLTINRSGREGYFRPAERERALAILPHLRAAYLLQQRLGWLDVLARTFRSSLDRLNEGVLMLNRLGVIRFSNEASDIMASQGVFHRGADGRIRLPTHRQSVEFETFTRSSHLGAQHLVMQVQDAGGRWIANLKACFVEHIVSCSWGEPEAGIMAFLTAAPTAAAQDRRESWKKIWKFTRAEADLALHLASGRSLAEAAEFAEVSINTVRTQLRAILAKTETKRQSELVRVLLLSGE